MSKPIMAPGAYDAQEEAIRRRMKFAEALQTPTASGGQMVGNHFVPMNPIAGLADILRSKWGADQRQGAEQELKDLGTKRQEAMSKALRTFGEMSNPSQEGLGPTNLVNDALPEEFQIGAQTQLPARKPDMQGAYASLIESGIPQLQQMGSAGMIQLPQLAAQRQDKIDAREAAHTQRMDELRQRAEDSRATLADRMKAEKEMQERQLAFQKENGDANRANQAFLARLGASLRQPAQAQIIQTDAGPMQLVGGKAVPITSMVDGKPVKAANAQSEKPMPATALKMQQESIDMIDNANNTNADLAGFEKQIQDGKLNFGLFTNAANSLKNKVGASDAESRNYESFKTNLERLRNESLRLNKGVQTDGDAQRAWNELMQNITDKDIVSQRLKEIQGINKRGAELQKLNVDSIRSNYGHSPFDYSNRKSPSPYDKPAATPTGAPDAPRKRVRYDAQGNQIQ